MLKSNKKNFIAKTVKMATEITSLQIYGVREMYIV